MFLLLILVQCHISIPPENVRKPMVFWHFQGVKKCDIGLKSVKHLDACWEKCRLASPYQYPGNCWKSKLYTIYIPSRNEKSKNPPSFKPRDSFINQLMSITHNIFHSVNTYKSFKIPKSFFNMWKSLLLSARKFYNLLAKRDM